MQRIVNRQVALGVSRNRDEFNVPAPPQPDVLAAAERHVNGLRLAALRLKPLQGVAFVEDLVIGAVYVVAIAHQRIEPLARVAVRLPAGQNGSWRKLLDLVVAADVIE